MSSSLVRDLRAVLPADRVVDDPDVLEAYRTDQTRLPSGRPAVLVRPRSTDEVVACMRVANAAKVPVVARGAGSGLAGAANAVDGCIVLSMAAMDSILEIDPPNRLAVVQPGVVTQTLRNAVAGHGLFYPPDPGSVELSTIGGNVSTNAGGMCCVKYGVTGDFVLGLEVVLADGEVLRTGRRTVKGVVGYDLSRLFVGSEGTLGVVTEITLALRPAPPGNATVVATFPRLEDAGRAISAVVAAGFVPSLLEVLDRASLEALDQATNMGLGGPAAMLLAQSDSADAVGEVAAMARLFKEHGADDVAETDDPEEGNQLLAARRLAYFALERLGDMIIDDVAVPRSRLAELIRRIETVAADTGLTIATVGHAGDGNLHPNIIYDATDPESTRAAWHAFDAILETTLELGGTVTGEHGVGLLKRTWSGRELGDVSTRVHAAVKDALDPQHLLNPGKLLP